MQYLGLFLGHNQKLPHTPRSLLRIPCPLPIFFPTIMTLGFDAIWFGVILVIIMEMGLITPPVGMNVFVIKGVAQDVDIGTVYRGIFPFLLAMILCVIILTFFPEIALVLTRTMN